MPFVMAPSLSKLVAVIPSRQREASERRHGDGIRIDRQSPEALDGVFWSTYLARDKNRITPGDPEEEMLERYAMFIENLLLNESRERYLSKMNQRIDLLPKLADYFEKSLFLLPFRDPLQQAASLLQQHRRFARLSAYETEYLCWLDHRDFGVTHLGFYESGAQAASRFSPDSLDYWLDQWRRVYAYLSRLAEHQPRLIPLCYEELATTDGVWRMLSQHSGIEISGAGFYDRNNPELDSSARVDTALLQECRALYAQLAQPAGAGSC